MHRLYDIRSLVGLYEGDHLSTCVLRAMLDECDMLQVMVLLQSLTPYPGGGGGGGGTDSFSLGANYETTAPLFGQRTAPVLLPPNLQLPIFTDAQGQPLEINSD